MQLSAIKLLLRLEKKTKTQFISLVLLMLAAGFVEMFSLGLLIPFLTAIAEPEKITQTTIYSFFKSFAEKNLNQSIFAKLESNLPICLTMIYILSIAISCYVRITFLRKNAQLANDVGVEISSKIYDNLLNQNLKFHLRQNSSKIISTLVAKTSLCIVSISAICTVIVSIVMCLFICFALFIISPVPTLTIFILTSIIYYIVIKFNNLRFISNSVIISKTYDKITKTLQESLQGIRDIILYNIQEVHIDAFRALDKKLRAANASVSIISQTPRFYIEALGISTFAIISCYLVKDKNSFITTIPALAALALGISKLLPAIQQIYSSWAIVLAHNESTNDLLMLLKLKKTIKNNNNIGLSFKKKIIFKNVSFCYNNNKKWVLKNVSFNIHKGSKVALIGETGSGKSTTLDLLMGLLRPVAGEIKIDNKILNPVNCVYWKNIISHVPQHIFIADKSVAENIALGIPAKKIDTKRVKLVSKIAHLDAFVEKLPQKYDTFLGERGSSISGGQRQRIGIARALYKNCELLVFDEATSALDKKTEQNIINSLVKYCKDLTIIFVTHKKEPLKICSKIITIKSPKY